MRISNEYAHAQINLKEWWPAKDVAPWIFKKFEKW